MPAMGESVTEGVVLEWAKAVGDSIEADETIVEISTDKVDAEVPAPASGTVTEILAEAGDTVTVGQVLARMTAGAAAKRADGPGAAAGERAAPGGRSAAAHDPWRRLEGHAGRQARRRRPRGRPLARAGQRPRRPHRQGRRAGRGQRRRPRARPPAPS